ncbi:hypothetical protein BP5796_02200 [Coleophoma crateriformis]|uniref:Tafazzin n=1 Tax=Coleophoma crateriformis TaxID=565419 RepID=A0A3D8SXJ6_9HELO|nr:hypothetical protein BP5796_02200 [Coleophoma crateriformis]
MPKKRFTSQYSKPQSTVHPSLGSGFAVPASSSHATPSVNELISSLRKTQISTSEDQTRFSATVVTPTLPPSIRTLLAIPDTPPPRLRDRNRRRYDENGRRIPAGPAPPRSWLETSQHAPVAVRKVEYGRLYPHNVEHLPGVVAPVVGSLQDHCLKSMARNWLFIREYETYNLSDLPTRIRVLLLSYIAVYGSDQGIGYTGLKSILTPPPLDEDEEEELETDTAGSERNENLQRLDLSGSVGRSVSLKQLSELLIRRSAAIENESWEESIPTPMGPVLPHLTHLSLAYPPGNISWPKLLSFAQHVPTLTHLSLAHWPVPNLTPNSRTTVMSSPHLRDVQYGGTNYYSHTLDGDFAEASVILKRLANFLYSLKWLDVTGCSTWLKAMQYGSVEESHLEWSTQWLSLDVLIANTGYELEDGCQNSDIEAFRTAWQETMDLKSHILTTRKKAGRKSWIDVQAEKDSHKWCHLWTGPSEHQCHAQGHSV